MGSMCVYCGVRGNIGHHPLMYAGRQIDEITVLLCDYCHTGNNGTIWQDVREFCEALSIKNNLDYLQKNYTKTNWNQRLKYLESYPQNKFDRSILKTYD